MGVTTTTKTTEHSENRRRSTPLVQMLHQTGRMPQLSSGSGEVGCGGGRELDRDIQMSKRLGCHRHGDVKYELLVGIEIFLVQQASPSKRSTNQVKRNQNAFAHAHLKDG